MGKILKKISKILSSILFVMLIGIAVLLVGYVISIKVLTKQNRLGDVPINFYTILTQSMYPKIKAGDIIITYKNEGNIYNVNDVITFTSVGSSGGITITHRIKEVKVNNGKYSYVVKGDNNNAPDPGEVESNRVIGKMVFKIPKAGYIQQFLVTKFGLLVAIILPCAGILIYDVVKIVKKSYNKKKEKSLLYPISKEQLIENNIDPSLEGTSPEEIEKEIREVYEEFNIPEVEDEIVETLESHVEEQSTTIENPVEQTKDKKEEDDEIEIL